MARTRRLLTLLAVLLVVAAVAVWEVGRHPAGRSDAAPAPATATSAPTSIAPTADTLPSSPTSEPASGAPSPAPATASSSSTSQCTASRSFVPTRFAIPRLKITVPVVPVDEQSSNGTMAPPVDQPWEVAWIDTSNKPASHSPGVINLTAHTYHAGGAIGNSLYLTNPLRSGDLIVLSDGSGHQSCYRYTKQVKFSAASYTSNSTVFYDQQSSPQVRLMICWDYHPDTRYWASRVVFYANPVRS
ncbi:MAG TPA: class F sortase [Propionibacteriaceae bacterium]|nr:class F sortase [Propionibacteriaceae bacterium]